MTTRLACFTRKAAEEPHTWFTALMGLVFDPEGLHASFERQRGRRAPGVDGMRKVDYAEGLTERITDLSGRVRRLGYRPQPVRRVYVPKGRGRRRALGIPCFEDRLVQDRLSMVLQRIWEPEFLECSYGFRPGLSAHDALRRLAEVITNGRTQWVVEADIKGFFDRVSHEHLMRFLEHRIADPNFLRIIRRFLKAGVMEDGMVSASEEGTPQGGLMTPPTQWVTLISRSSFPTGGESGPTREDDIKGSIIVALLIVCLCHGRFASSSSRSVRPAGQRRHPVARGWGFSRSGTSTGSPISIITTPSLALCGTGPQPRRGRGAQAQGGVYGEAADGPRSSCSPPRQAERTDPQCVGYARFEGVPGSFGWRFSRWRIGGLNWTTSSTA